MTETTSPLIHFYRATVNHADTWSKRLDATTNWAIVTTVGVVSFSFSSTQTPHFLLLMLLVANTFFLLMESRRYQLYDVWQERLNILHRYYFAPALAGHRDPEQEKLAAEKLRELGKDLGETVPRLNTTDAIGFRIRRNYYYIFLVTLGAWFLKLYIHPINPAPSWEQYFVRATVGVVDGALMVAAIVLFALVALVLALQAPSEYLVKWTEQPSPIERLFSFRWFEDPNTEQRPPRPWFQVVEEDPESSSSEGV